MITLLQKNFRYGNFLVGRIKKTYEYINNVKTFNGNSEFCHIDISSLLLTLLNLVIALNIEQHPAKLSIFMYDVFLA